VITRPDEKFVTNKTRIVILLLLSSTLPRPNGAVDLLRVEARAKVGLNAETLALVRGMPKEIREQALALLREALPLVDKSVYGYLDRLDETIANAACKLEGVGESVFSIGKRSLVDDLEEEREDLRSEFSSDSSPQEYEDAYADFISNAALALCRTEEAPTKTTIHKKRDDVYDRWLIWNRLGSSCSNAAECLTKVREATTFAIAAADPRDILSADARSRFSKPFPIPERGLWDRIFSSFPHEEYEREIERLLAIQDTIQFARVKRERWYQFYQIPLPLAATMHVAQVGNQCFAISLASSPTVDVKDSGCHVAERSYVRPNNTASVPGAQIQEISLDWDRQAAKAQGVPAPTLSAADLSFGVRCTYRQGFLIESYPKAGAGPDLTWAQPGERCGNERGSPLLLSFSMQLTGSLIDHFELSFSCFGNGTWYGPYTSKDTCKLPKEWPVSQINILLRSRGSKELGGMMASAPSTPLRSPVSTAPSPKPSSHIPLYDCAGLVTLSNQCLANKPYGYAVIGGDGPPVYNVITQKGSGFHGYLTSDSEHQGKTTLVGTLKSPPLSGRQILQVVGGVPNSVCHDWSGILVVNKDVLRKYGCQVKPYGLVH
jgi:hypothetical protein